MLESEAKTKNHVSLEIWFGALSEKPSNQIMGQMDKLPHKPHNIKNLKMIDRLADAIVLLHMNSIITESEVHKARNRLMKQIQKYGNEVSK